MLSCVNKSFYSMELWFFTAPTRIIFRNPHEGVYYLMLPPPHTHNTLQLKSVEDIIYLTFSCFV